MSLSGYAAELATKAGLGELAVSLTHEEGIAGAVVVALCRDDPDEEHRSGDLEFESAGAL